MGVEILLAIAVGFSCGISTILAIAFGRNHSSADSLVRLHQLSGYFGVVAAPFNRQGTGKIRVLANGSMVELLAKTDSPHEFVRGERAFIIEVCNRKAWVVPEVSLQSDPEIHNPS